MMFGKSKSMRIVELKTIVASLQSVLEVNELQRRDLRRGLNAAERSVINRDATIHNLRKELAAVQKERAAPHQHDFTDLELRVLAAVADSHKPFSATGRWAAGMPSLQELPRPRPAPVLASVSFEYRGKRATFPLSNSTIKLELEEANEGRTLRVIVHKPDNTTVHYDYIAADITSEIRKEWH